VGQPGDSAAEALEVLSAKVNKLLGATNGTAEKLVRLASPRDHAVKCFIDLPGVLAFDHHLDVFAQVRRCRGCFAWPAGGTFLRHQRASISAGQRVCKETRT
jgi:hypothetical protein